MPYIITTKQEHLDGWKPLSRRAVATLDEARSYAFRSMVEYWPDKQVGEGPNLMDLPGAGGTIGPLPDGTVIEIERVIWFDLARDLPEISWNMLTRASSGYLSAQSKVFDAYNARSAS